METASIRELRKRLGWTQWDLAEHLSVDQGTVSRWERGLGSPRPASAAELRDLILREDSDQAVKRCSARVYHSLLPAIFLDGSARIRVINAVGARRYRKDFGLNVYTHIGYEMERHAQVLSMEPAWDCFRASRFLNGDLLFARFYFNKRGKGHVTLYEPVFELGKLLGFSATVIGTFGFPPNDEVTLERVEVVHVDAPETLVDIYRGPMAEFARYP